jgi:progranulin
VIFFIDFIQQFKVFYINSLKFKKIQKKSPFPNAQCCSDDIHCCPENYICNTAEGRCDKKTSNGTLTIPIGRRDGNNINARIVCPGATATCTSDQTCCALKSGDWGCCPIPNADCCKDDEHCCPAGYTCDLKNNRCNKDSHSTVLYRKEEAVKVKTQLNPCPGGKTGCPDTATCCSLSNGDYACCPLQNAVCCADNIHCCPNGFQCDVADGRCLKGNNETLSIQSKFESTKMIIEEPLDSVVCPDGSSFCPDDYTCCLNEDQSYGCCPMKKASCCSDHLHCCPENTTCNVEKGACEHAISKTHHFITTWKQKKVAQKLKFNSNEVKIDPIICKDNSTCDPLKTCCLMSNEAYGCW